MNKLIFFVLFFCNICHGKVIDFIVDSYAPKPFGSCKLDAQLLLPEKPIALAIFIHGSGALDKDGPVQSFKPYKDIAKELYENNIATVRYDKRNSIATCANLMNHPDFTYKVFVTDIENVIEKALSLEENRRLAPFLIGHSQGVNFSSLIAKKDSRVMGQVLIAGLGHFAIDETVMRQFENILRKPNIPMGQRFKLRQILEEAKNFFEKIRSHQIKKDDFFMGAYATFWSSYIKMTKNAAKTASEVSIPSLVIQGTLDENITKKDFDALVLVTKKVKGSESKMFEDLDHLMLSPNTQHVSKKVSEKISKWIKGILSNHHPK